MLFHGDEERNINDLDIWIDNERENAKACFNALTSIMSGHLNFQPNDLFKEGRKIDLKKSHYDVELFTSMDGAKFGESFPRCKTCVQDGESLYFIGVQDLLCIKRLAYEICHERRDKEGKDIAFLARILNL